MELTNGCDAKVGGRYCGPIILFVFGRFFISLINFSDRRKPYGGTEAYDRGHIISICRLGLHALLHNKFYFHWISRISSISRCTF